MTARARAEWHPLRRVVVRPPGIEAFFGLLEPYASLYERVFSLRRARREHEELAETLRSGFGVSVQYLDQLLLQSAGRHPDVAEEIVRRAVATVEFRGPGSARARREFGETLRQLDRDQLIETLVLAPEIRFERGRGSRSVTSYTTLRQPLTNLFFLRDQQAVTDRGIVVGRLAKPQRRRETELTSFVWTSSGERPVARIERGTFEGGDFLPAGDFALLGTGDRTNATGVQEFLASGTAFDEVGVVHQPRHPLLARADPMVNMHLDTYLNFPGDGIAVGHREMLQLARVDVYLRDSGVYRRSHTTHLLPYLEKNHGFRVIGISTLEQLCYASNFLTIKDRSIVVPEVGRNAEKVLANLRRVAERYPARYHRLFLRAAKEFSELRSSGQFFPHKPEAREVGLASVQTSLENLTGAFGGAHCLTATLERA
ncbi:MAG TPA: arginine deiminase family protein [Thermoplasmata archaeon]|nr:arginine deiminase family protein [Thermoplasmata archaeon]